MAFRDDILTYLGSEKDIILNEQDTQENLSIEEKIEKGILIKNAELIKIDSDNNQAFFKCIENNSKFRPGDKIAISSNSKDALIVIENGLDEITVQYSSGCQLKLAETYNLEAVGVCLIDNIVKLLETIRPGASGYGFIRNISTYEADRNASFLKKPFVDQNKDIYERAMYAAVSGPSFFCIQGPPGTGKTTLLAKIVSELSEAHKKVLIIANTHQAVNNALNAVNSKCPKLFIAKIGHWLKRDKLQSGVEHYKNLWTCASALKQEKDKARKKSPIVGMTFLSAVLEVGLQTAGFSPDVVLIDEAGQIPLPYASVLGRFMAQSMIFFGDEKQMPPIFRTELRESDLSISIFEHLKNLYPESSITLDKTFRMNAEICDCIQRYFYPEVTLQPYSADVAQRKFSQELQKESEHQNQTIKEVFNNDSSIQVILSENTSSTDCNNEEASLIRELVVEAEKLLKDNWNKRIAVITPYRRQVRLIRSLLLASGISAKDMPLIDTVERLQGQQVDMIILSFCSSDQKYIRDVASFLLDKNRVNVMISRAKTKVVILASPNVINFSSSNRVCNLLQHYYK